MFQLTSSILFLKGQVYEAMDNRGLAADCYKQALRCDVHCYEAFEALVQHQMLSAQEGKIPATYKNFHDDIVSAVICVDTQENSGILESASLPSSKIGAACNTN